MSSECMYVYKPIWGANELTRFLAQWVKLVSLYIQVYIAHRTIQDATSRRVWIALRTWSPLRHGNKQSSRSGVRLHMEHSRHASFIWMFKGHQATTLEMNLLELCYVF